MTKMTMLPDVECCCDKCKSMCLRPCWGTPEELEKIIDAGFSHKLMMDYFEEESGNDRVYLLCGALQGYEGKRAPYWPQDDRGCAFFNEQRLCDLHDSKIKPVEGRVADCNHIGDDDYYIHEEVAMLWNTNKGRSVLAKWKKIVGFKE